MTEFTTETSNDDVREPFDAKAARQEHEDLERKIFGCWIRKDLKEKYDRIQRASGRKFSQRLIDLIEAEIARALE